MTDAHQPAAAHDLRFDTPATVWDEAIPLANGILGALVWGGGQPLRISLDRTDLWDLRPVPEFQAEAFTYANVVQLHREGRHDELIRLCEDPYGNRAAPTKIPAGRIELSFDDALVFAETGLHLREALAWMRFANGAQARVFVHATQPVGMIAIRGAGAPPRVRLMAPPFAGQVSDAAAGGIVAGDLAQLGYPPTEYSNGAQHQAFVQRGAEGLSFAACLVWDQGGGEWQAAWSIASSFEGADPLRLASERAHAALSGGFDHMLDSHRQWWVRYWAQSSLSLPNPVLEKQWYLEQYKFGAASRRGAPPITLQGPWTADTGQVPPWKGDYHHDLNTQLSYWPCYSGNHLEEGLSFLDWLWDTRAYCIDYTRRFFDLPGLNVPGTATLTNAPLGGWRQYSFSPTVSAWLAHHFYLHWRYSADRDFLRERAYPYLRDAAVFVEAISSQRDVRGLRTLPLSASPEINNNRPDAWFDTLTNFDLALMRWLMDATADLAAEVGDADEARHWRAVLAEFSPLAQADDASLLVAPAYPLPESHRHFSHLMSIHPLGMIDWDDGEEAQRERSRRTIRASLEELQRLGTDYWCGYSFAWLACLSARARDGQAAERALDVFATAFCLRNSFHCNGDQSGKGYSQFTYRPFTLEGNFAAAAGVQEMLLQSQHGRLRVFPAVPPDWADVSFTTLRAEGAFLVSAQRRSGATERVEIVAERGGTCRIISPWDGVEIVRQMQPGEHWVLER